MIVAAIDVSASTSKYLKFYQNQISQVLLELKDSIHIILWNHRVVCKTDIDNEKDLRNILHFKPYGNTLPQCFIKTLPNKTPINLYVFTDGQLFENDIVKCRAALKESELQISHVHLYYIGDKNEMGLQFTTVFQNFPHEIFIQGNKIATVNPKTIFDFKDVDYQYIMKDNSLKARIITLVRDHKVDKVQLKAKVKTLMNSILKQHFEFDVKNSIRKFYETKDVLGCVNYIKKHSYYNEKAKFQRKMSDIFTLFDENINTYAISVYDDVTEEPNDFNVNTEEEELQSKDDECLTCDILYDVCGIACIPIKACNDKLWPDKNMIRNPFHLLESEEWIQEILNRVEPFVLDYNKTFMNLQTPVLSPFSRDPLKGVYVLYHPKLNADEVASHNNYILSNFFTRKLPGKPVLWHVVFLYLVATRKFPEHKEVFFRDIRFLCQREKYYVSLTAYLNPPIVDALEVCFWYVACVCPVAWPNNKKNVLRKADFVSGKILEFYREVYDPQYEQPKDMQLWQLWYAICREKTDIFQILSRYFRHERVAEDNFGIILYREKLQQSQQLNLEIVLKMYSRQKFSNFYEDLSDISNDDLPVNGKMLLNDQWESRNNTLDHVHINLATCHPYVFCPVSDKYWQECAGKYDKMKESYVRLFKHYCENCEMYPEKGTDLMVFLNKWIFERTNLPELFDLNVSHDLNQVVEIFREVMEKYTCKEYIETSNKMSSEHVRAKYEDKLNRLELHKKY